MSKPSEATLQRHMSEIAEGVWRANHTMSCTKCGAEAGEPHKGTCPCLASGMEWHRLRPDLFSADGQPIFTEKQP